MPQRRGAGAKCAVTEGLAVSSTAGPPNAETFGQFLKSEAGMRLTNTNSPKPSKNHFRVFPASYVQNCTECTSMRLLQEHTLASLRASVVPWPRSNPSSPLGAGPFSVTRNGKPQHPGRVTGAYRADVNRGNVTVSIYLIRREPALFL
jgi:hypothetical protein